MSVRILVVDGRLDATTSDALQEKIRDLVGQGEKLFVIDGAKLSYLSRSGLRVLLRALKKPSVVSGLMTICSLNDRVQEVFEMTRLTLVFDILATRDEAITKLKGVG